MVTNQHKLRVGVFMGGRSIEREVSFTSGRTICDHLDTTKYDVTPIFQAETGEVYILPAHFLHRGKIADFYNRLETEAQKISWDSLKRHVDFVYLAMHGRYGEDGTIQGIFEVLKIPYLGSKILSSALGMNKEIQKSILKSHGINVPNGIVVQGAESEILTEKQLGEKLRDAQITLPVVVKPSHEGSSLGVSISKTLSEALSAIKIAAHTDDRLLQSVLVEEKIEGMEFTAIHLQRIQRGVNGLEKTWLSLPITEIEIDQSKAYLDYAGKYMPGCAVKITPARCSAEATTKIQEACKRVSEILGFSTVSRIDGFYTKDGTVIIIDPNSLAGMAPSAFIFHQAAQYGMSHTDLINFLIHNELTQYGLTDGNEAFAFEGASMSSENKLRVAVLLGGDSNEREISLESGKNICYKLSPHKYQVIPVFINNEMELFKIGQELLVKNTTKAINDALTPEMKIEWSDLPQIADFVFIGLHGGKGENGAVQGALEMLNLPYNGSGVLASSMCMDKYRANDFLRSQGFDVPNSYLVEASSWHSKPSDAAKEEFLSQELAKNGLKLPVICKPYDDGCSVGVSKCSTLQELAQSIKNVLSMDKNGVLIEELIQGIELTVGVLGNDNPTALPPSLSVAKKGILSIEEKFLPGEGENQTPAPLPTSVLDFVRRVIKNAFVTMGCKGYSRIDCFYQDSTVSPTGKDRLVLIEFNTLPAMTPATCIFHQAAEIGIRPMDFVDKIVELGLQLHDHKKQSLVLNQKTHSIAPAEEAAESFLSPLSLDEVKAEAEAAAAEQVAVANKKTKKEKPEMSAAEADTEPKQEPATPQMLSLF